MADEPIYRGWDLLGRAKRTAKRAYSNAVRSNETRQMVETIAAVAEKIEALSLDDPDARESLAAAIAQQVLRRFTGLGADEVDDVRYLPALTATMSNLIEDEGWFELPNLDVDVTPLRSDLWDMEDRVRRTQKIVSGYDDVLGELLDFVTALIAPIVEACPALLEPVEDDQRSIAFSTEPIDTLPNMPTLVEHLVQGPFSVDDEAFNLWPALRARLETNLITVSGGIPGDPVTYSRTYKLPTKLVQASALELIKSYLAGTPFVHLFAVTVPLTLSTSVRFEHHHIVAGSGHGKTQTLQHLILNDLPAVAAGERSIVVIDSQSDLINTIAGLDLFTPGEPLADRLVLIDPTDVEWPVALNLFDVGMERIGTYSQLDQERLTNSVLELYDFVLGSLLDAGMTQKQSVIFRYITRLLLRIPNATIHTFRELLDVNGFQTYQAHIEELQGSARSFFDNEYQGPEFKQTRKQVLRRLYGILENQTFERMFSHPKSKLDLFSEMNAGKVILINTAKDLLKENGTEIFGRFFIAMIAQAAQERAVLPNDQRLPTFVYIDEANDYFDRNIGIILSQARKYNVGMILAHQFLGQLDSKLYEAVAANTSIKFAGGVSAKDARTLASDLRCDATFIDNQQRLSFAAYIKGRTDNAASITIEPGQMERRPRLTEDHKAHQREAMRAQYAVHYTEIGKECAHDNGEADRDMDTDPQTGAKTEADAEAEPRGERETKTDTQTKPPSRKHQSDGPPEDDGQPMRWE